KSVLSRVIPQSVQGTLIFYLTWIVVFINVFFAIITLSRENLNFYKEGAAKTNFLGRILQEPVRELFKTGSSVTLNRLFENREPGMANIRVTIYDRNWWSKFGDPSRLPPEGFPHSLSPNTITSRSGVSGKSSREVFFAVSSGSEWIGTIGIGVPEFQFSGFYESFYQVAFTAGVNIFLGVALAIFIAQIILRPLSFILEGLDAIKRGNYSQRVPINGTGELATLGSMFNLMASALQEKIREEVDRNRKLDEINQELWEIYELTKTMGFTLPLQHILERFLEKAQTLSFSSYGQVLLFISEGRQLQTKVEAPYFPRIPREVYEKGLADCLGGNERIEVQWEGYTLLFHPLLS
ncbi:HAMP domain-containing protein, partial [bacterium]|nr:HAMP domain-containing protein [bacterium]